jgi:hypothetical protein
VDGVDIAGDNSVKIKGNGRVSSNYLIRSHQIGDILQVKIIRGKKEKILNFPLKTRVMIAPLEYEKDPRYYILGGMVFMPLTINYLKVWGKNWYRKAPIDLMYPVLNADKLDSDIEELVVLSNILPNDENANYNTALKLISQVNGKKITSLNGFVQTVEESKERYLNILFSDGRRVVLDKENAIKSDLETMKKYGITKKKYLE